MRCISGAKLSSRTAQMATPKPKARTLPRPRPASKRQFPWIGATVVLVAAVVAVWWFYGDAMRGYALAGTGYGAKNACSCRHVSGRELNSCEDDFVPGMAVVFLSEDEDDKSVTASVPLVASQTARYREGFGCVLDSMSE